MVKTVEVPTGMQAIVASSIRHSGLKSAAKALGLHEKSALRIAAGIPSQAGTIAIVEKALGSAAARRGRATKPKESK